MISIDTLAYSSPLRQKSPAVKTALAVGSLLICVAARSIVVSVCVLAVMATLTILVGKIPVQKWGALMLLPLSFIILGTVAVIFHVSSAPTGLFSLPVNNFYLSVDSVSLLYGSRLIATAFSSVSCLYFLSLTTPMTDLIPVLRKLRCPALLLELMFLIYRFLFVLLDIATAIRTAQHCRLGNRDKKTALKSSGALLAVLLQRSFSCSTQLYDAMESRCYDGEIRVLNRISPATARDIVFSTAVLCVLSALALVTRMSGGWL